MTQEQKEIIIGKRRGMQLAYFIREMRDNPGKVMVCPTERRRNEIRRMYPDLADRIIFHR